MICCETIHSALASGSSSSGGDEHNLGGVVVVHALTHASSDGQQAWTIQHLHFSLIVNGCHAFRLHLVSIHFSSTCYLITKLIFWLSSSIPWQNSLPGVHQN